MRRFPGRAGFCVISVISAICTRPAFCEDAQEILRKSVGLDQLNWQRRADYTWMMETRERHFDSQNHVTSDHQEALETLVLDGRPYSRAVERDHKPLPPAEQKKEQERLDRIAARLDRETAAEKERHIAEYEASRRRERQFLLEVTSAFDIHLEGDQMVQGHPAWVISGTPKPGYHPRSREGAAMLKIRGKIWIEKADYQWVRVEGETIGTISFGWFLARLNPGAKLVLEQSRVNDEVWLPSRLFVSGSGRIGLLERLAQDEEITWSNYRKFRVDSKVISQAP
jgi:hypothetical protein